MSQETSQWLNTNTLIGFTEKRGEAWHYRAEDQGDQSNHYPGAIPVEDVRERLFSWTGEEAPVMFEAPGGRLQKSTEHKVIYRSDTLEDLGVFKNGYRVHQYDQWLIRNMQMVTDSDLEVGSAGLLRKGGQAWVQFEFPETLQAADVAFRPFLCAATSMDGSMSSTYFAGAQLVVCDNTLAAGVQEADREGSAFKVKHSVNSLNRIGDVRDALRVVHQAAEAFEQEVAALTSTVVTDDQWAAFVAAYTATDSETERSANMAEKKAGELNALWNADDRVSPWKGSAFGVLQAVNTHAHHFQTVRGASRADRNMSRVISGGVADLDRGTMAMLQKVMVAA